MGKYKKLALSIVLDAIGYFSYAIPGIGEMADLVWAPASAWIMIRMYRGNKGKVAAVVSFVEEALPGLDIVPTFTLMWLYTYVFTKTKSETKQKQKSAH
ncbi:hypothetical protein [Mangrovimonas aestuarii]|uniref:hypothetical protein n=1 Tax=Mangrovimonas aestuarii TaxID=3018443 RepID=UPI002379CEA0|nr:hypothetical protein [Mangrovimonas aestuarii]